jgi:pilus assembly protein Flp/PilA
MNGSPAHGESGATAVEYALMVALIAAVILGTVALIGGGTHGLFTQICGADSPFGC